MMADPIDSQDGLPGIFAGLAKDCPFREGAPGEAGKQLTAESVQDVDTEAFAEYASRLYQYLQVFAVVCSSKLN